MEFCAERSVKASFGLNVQKVFGWYGHVILQ